jgi:hypothetical protein
VFGSERLSWCFLSQAREYILRLMGSFDTLWFSDQVQSVSEIIGGASPRLIITYESCSIVCECDYKYYPSLLQT